MSFNIRDEPGQALLLAVMALALGMLAITPFLGHAGASLIGSRIYEQDIQEQYAGDAGIEYAIWGLLGGTLVVAENTTSSIPAFYINNKTVDVTVENTGSGIYRITAVAASEDNHRTTVISFFLLGEGEWTTDGNITGGTTGDIYIQGDADVAKNVTVDGGLYVTGNGDIGKNAEITGDVFAGGDLELSKNGIIGGDVSANGTITLEKNSSVGSLGAGGNICAGGDIVLEKNVTVYGSIYTTGNLEMNKQSVIKGDVFIGGDIATIILFKDAQIEGNIYITGSVTDRIQLADNAFIEGDVFTTGTINDIIRPENILGDVFENYTGGSPAAPG